MVKFTEIRVVALGEVDGEYLKQTLSTGELGLPSVPLSYTPRNDGDTKSSPTVTGFCGVPV